MRGPGGVPAGVPRQTAPAKVRTWVPDGPFDLGLVLGPLRRGPGDPTFRAMPDGSVWRASLTPAGPGTLRVAARGGEVRGEAWGRGRLAAGAVAGAARRGRRPVGVPAAAPAAGGDPAPAAGLRLTRTGLVLESLIPSVLEQKVTTVEAYQAWRLLVRKYGEPAPGPVPGRMYVMPAPRTWALIPSWEWHRAGVDDKRASTILRAVRVAARLEEAVRMEPAAAQSRLEVVPGIGPWTSAEVVQRSHGAPDAVTVGDLHLPGIVGWALAGTGGR